MNIGDLGEMCARQMERAEERFGEEVVLRDFALIVELDYPGSSATFFDVVCSDDRPRNQLAFLEEAIAAVDARRLALEDREQLGDGGE